MPETENGKKILLIDLDDARRDSRVMLLTNAGYTVDLRNDHITAERLNHEDSFDLIILALHNRPESAVAYSDQLSKDRPTLPILLLTDYGISLNRSVEGGSPAEFLGKVAAMLEGSIHIRELPIRP